MERGNTVAKSGGTLNTIANIGLMYPSDYAYSLFNSENNGNLTSAHYNLRNNYITDAWMYILSGEVDSEWAITSGASATGVTGIYACLISLNGAIVTEGTIGTTGSIYHAPVILSVRPTFYLKNNVMLSCGSGTKENPYRISINE